MKKLKVYLAGAIKNADLDFQNWREECCSRIEYGRIDFIDPNEYFNYHSKLPMTNRQCRDFFMNCIERCDLLLINLDYSDSSCGSCMEAEHALCRNIPIIGFGEKKDTWYDWLKCYPSVIFDTLDEALEYINEYYGTI